jgi:hypothetical protein
MPPFIIIIAIVSLVALAAGVADTIRSASRQGGLPAASFTYRAYGA